VAVNVEPKKNERVEYTHTGGGCKRSTYLLACRAFIESDVGRKGDG
jgi:hypothetical protein